MERQILSVGILPWLPLTAPVIVGEVTFYPAAAAISLLAGQGPVLADRLRIYRETWDDIPAACSVALHSAQIDNGGHAPASDIRTAADILMTASMFENDGGPISDANATTFTLYMQVLGGEIGFVAPRSRRRYGGFVSGSSTDFAVRRPLCCGNYCGYDRELLDALVAALGEPNAWRLFDALAWFRRASTDSEDVDRTVDIVLMLTAIDFLLAHPGTHGAGLDQARMASLLQPFDTIVCDRIKDVDRSHIQTVMFVLNDVRNATVHPNPSSRAVPYDFETRKDVAFPWIVDRCFFALLVARLAEIGTLALTDSVRAFIAGVERWVKQPTDPLAKMVLDEKLAYGLRGYFEDMHRREVVEAPQMSSPDEARVHWERDFSLVLPQVSDGRQVRLLWLTEGDGILEVWDVRRRPEWLVEYLRFSLDDEPTRMAYAIVPLVRAPFSESEPVMTQDRPGTARAMSDPRVFLGAQTERW